MLLEVAVVVSPLGVRQLDDARVAVPEEPHRVDQGAAVWSNGGEVGEEGTFEQVQVGFRRLGHAAKEITAPARDAATRPSDPRPGAGTRPRFESREAGAGRVRKMEIAVKDKMQGKAEELKGKVTGDRATELKGKARQAVG